MKSLCRYWMGIMFLAICLGCETANGPKKTIVAEDGSVVVEDETPKKVKIVYAVKTDFPSGQIEPDRVTMDGNPIRDTFETMTGMHTFVIEKAGYEKNTVQLMVRDPEDTRIYYLNAVLTAKQRIVKFYITDELTGAIIPNPTVAISIPKLDAAESEPLEMLSDGSFVKPGTKKLVIQKRGYENFSADITISPDDNPYILKYSLKPLAKTSGN